MQRSQQEPYHFIKFNADRSSADILCQLLTAEMYFSVVIKATSIRFKWRLSLGLLFSTCLTPGSAQYLCIFLAHISDVTHRRLLSIEVETLDILFQTIEDVVIRISTKKTFASHVIQGACFIISKLYECVFCENAVI